MSNFLLTASAGITTSGENLIRWFQGLTYVVIAASLLITFLMFVIPSEESKAKARKHIPWVLVGAIGIVGVLQISKDVLAQIVF